MSEPCITAQLFGWPERTASVACRLLSGTGSGTLAAYRIDPHGSIAVLAHGATRDGLIAVVLSRDEALPDADLIDVRLDIEKHAPEITARITAATLHSLAVLSWIDDDERAAWEAHGTAPRHVLDAARAPGARLAALSVRRTVLHDASGVHRVPLERIASDLSALAQRGASPFPLSADEFEVAEALREHVNGELGCLMECVLANTCAGAVLRRDPSCGLPEEARDITWCVDVDSTGVTLMHTGSQSTVTAFAAFAQPVAGLDELRQELAALVPAS
ncbi:MAG: hypothetical protein L0G23_01635 [Ruaniaceae bacterium]|nr:hypothetical protein [Ruaniaceae bacterium]